MRIRGLLISRVLLLVPLLAAAPHAKTAPPRPATSDNGASIAPEVRLRKLHLVRPDLILYPIEHEVYC